MVESLLKAILQVKQPTTAVYMDTNWSEILIVHATMMEHGVEKPLHAHVSLKFPKFMSTNIQVKFS